MAAAKVTININGGTREYDQAQWERLVAGEEDADAATLRYVIQMLQRGNDPERAGEESSVRDQRLSRLIGEAKALRQEGLARGKVDVDVAEEPAAPSPKVEGGKAQGHRAEAAREKALEHPEGPVLPLQPKVDVAEVLGLNETEDKQPETQKASDEAELERQVEADKQATASDLMRERWREVAQERAELEERTARSSQSKKAKN